MVPTLMAAAGEPDVKENCLTATTIGGKTYKVHLDGYNLCLLCRAGHDTRQEFLYLTDDGNLAALRYDNWKFCFMEQRAHGFDVWEEPFVTLRVPMLEDLHTDPFERGPEEGIDPYSHWRIDRVFPARSCAGLRRSPSLVSLVQGPSRRGRNLAVSRSIKCCRNCSTPGAARAITNVASLPKAAK